MNYVVDVDSQIQNLYLFNEQSLFSENKIIILDVFELFIK